MEHQTLTFSSYKGFSSPGAFVIEEDAVTSEHVVSLSVIDAHPKGIKFRAAVRRTRVKLSLFVLGNLLNLSVQLTLSDLLFNSRCLSLS